MAALTKAVERGQHAIVSALRNIPVANGDTIYFGAFVGVPDPDTGGLTSRRGYATPWQDEQGIDWAGLAINGAPDDVTTSNSVVGDTSPGTGVTIPAIAVEAGPFIIPKLNVTGLAAQTDLDKPVYLSNDNDATLTQGQSPRVGNVWYWHNTTVADVLFYGTIGHLVI